MGNTDDRDMHTMCDRDITRLGRENDALKAENAMLRAAGGFDNCTREQTKQLLDWFFYRVQPEARRELMAALPLAYNAYTGRQQGLVGRLGVARPVFIAASETPYMFQADQS